MSTQETDFISPEDLLMNVSAIQVSSSDTLEALGEYHRLIYCLREKQAACDELNDTARQLRAEGKTDDEAYRQTIEELELCVEETNTLEYKKIELQQREPLRSLYNELLRQSREKSNADMHRIQEQLRSKKEREYEQFVKTSERMTKQQPLRENILESLGCFGYLIAAALAMGVVILLIAFFGYIFSISPMWGYILMFGAFGCPLYFFTRKRWIFWLYLSIVVVLFFFLLSTQQFA